MAAERRTEANDSRVAGRNCIALASRLSTYDTLFLRHAQDLTHACNRPVVTFLLVLVIGIVAGILFDRVAGPSWFARQFSGSTRGIIITSALVGVAGAFVGYHIAMLAVPGGGLVTMIVAAVVGAAVVLFVWRMAK